jgi:hypothetical protein
MVTPPFSAKNFQTKRTDHAPVIAVGQPGNPPPVDVVGDIANDEGVRQKEQRQELRQPIMPSRKAASAGPSSLAPDRRPASR